MLTPRDAPHLTPNKINMITHCFGKNECHVPPSYNTHWTVWSLAQYTASNAYPCPAIVTPIVASVLIITIIGHYIYAAFLQLAQGRVDVMYSGDHRAYCNLTVRLGR